MVEVLSLLDVEKDLSAKPHVTDEPTIAQSSDEHDGNEVQEIEKEQDEASTSTIAPLDALSPRHSKRRTDTLFALLKEEAEVQKIKLLNFAHKTHTVKEISTVAKTHQIEITGVLEDAREVVTKLTGAMDENNRMIEQVEISKRNASLAINKAFETLQQTLEERKNTLLSELEAISLSKKTALTLQKEQFEKMIGDIGHYTDMASHILQTHTDHEIVALGGLIPTELQATLKRVQTISLTPNQESSITVSVQTDDLIQKLSKLGHLLDVYLSPSSSTWTSSSVVKVGTRYHVKVQSKTSKGEEYPHGGIEVKGEMRSKTHNGAVVYGEVEDHRDGTYTITLTPQTAGPHQLLITMDGQHVQYSPNNLDVRPKRDYRMLCNAQQVIQCNRPTCVAIHDNGDIYVVSDDGCIYVFDQTAQLKNTISSHGSGDGQFSYPCGISIKGDVLYVADSGNHRVQKLTSSGKFLHKFGQQGSGHGQFNSPWRVIIDSNNKLIVSEFNNHRIQIFNEDGGWLLTIDGNGSGNHRFQSPWGLALDPQGNIHVASWGSNTIKVFTKEGVYVRMYGDPNYPNGIAIDDEGYSLVNECWGDCLSIYNPEGNKIHTMRNLEDPYGVGGVMVECKDDTLDSYSEDEKEMEKAERAVEWKMVKKCMLHDVKQLSAPNPQDGRWRGSQAHGVMFSLWVVDTWLVRNIHVASWGSNTIKVFTKEGVYVRMYGDPNHPNGIAIDDEGYSLVNECWGDCLSIYNPEGNKIHTMRNLTDSYCTALDPRDGSVFIANYRANTNIIEKGQKGRLKVTQSLEKLQHSQRQESSGPAAELIVEIQDQEDDVNEAEGATSAAAAANTINHPLTWITTWPHTEAFSGCSNTVELDILHAFTLVGRSWPGRSGSDLPGQAESPDWQSP
eukprot:Em0004g214a